MQRRMRYCQAIVFDDLISITYDVQIDVAWAFVDQLLAAHCFLDSLKTV